MIITIVSQINTLLSIELIARIVETERLKIGFGCCCMHYRICVFIVAVHRFLSVLYCIAKEIAALCKEQILRYLGLFKFQVVIYNDTSFKEMFPQG